MTRLMKMAICAGVIGVSSVTARAAELERVEALFSSPISNAQFWGAYVAAKARGDYARAGIDVAFTEGQGAATSAQVVANGHADIGLGIGTSAVINVDGQGGDIRMIGTDTPVSTLAVISRAPKTIANPIDMKGKSIGVPPGTAQAMVFPAFLKRNRIAPESMTIVSLPITSMASALLQDRLDGYVSYSITNIPVLEARGDVKPHAMMFSDFDLRLGPDNGVVVTNAYLVAHKDMLKRFMAVSAEALAYAFDHPKEAAEQAKSLYPASINIDIAVAQIKLADSLFDATRASGKNLMWMSPNDWENQVNMLSELGLAINPQKPTTYYTNELLK